MLVVDDNIDSAEMLVHVEGVTRQDTSLYDHVEDVRGTLRPQALFGSDLRAIAGIALPTAALLSDLVEQAALGAQLSTYLATR